MIIKVLLLKTTRSIDRVAHYIASDKGRIGNYRTHSYFQNTLSTDLDKVIAELSDNYTVYAKKRTRGTVARHIILSTSPLDRQHMTSEKMDDIVRKYIEMAFPEAIVFGTQHREQKHHHTHLLVSGNDLASSKTTRQSKANLKEVHLGLQRYIHEKYPELSHGIDSKNWGRKLHSEKAYHTRKRKEVPLDKDTLAAHIQEVFRNSESSKDFQKQLERNGYKLYERNGHIQGIHWGGENKKMRFARLGIEPSHIQQLDKQNSRLRELEQIRANTETRSQERDFDGYSRR